MSDIFWTSFLTLENSSSLLEGLKRKIETHEINLFDPEVYRQLKAAEAQLLSANERFSHEDVINAALELLGELQGKNFPLYSG